MEVSSEVSAGRMNFQQRMDKYRHLLTGKHYGEFSSDLELYLAAIMINDVSIFKRTLLYLGKNSKENIGQFAKDFTVTEIAVAFGSDKILDFYLREFYAKKDKNSPIPGLTEKMGICLLAICYDSPFLENFASRYFTLDDFCVLSVFLFTMNRFEDLEKLETNIPESFREELKGKTLIQYTETILSKKGVSQIHKLTKDEIYLEYNSFRRNGIETKLVFESREYKEELAFFAEIWGKTENSFGDFEKSGYIYINLPKEDKNFVKNWLKNFRYEKLGYDEWYKGVLRMYELFGSKLKPELLLIRYSWLKPAEYLSVHKILKSSKFIGYDFSEKMSDVLSYIDDGLKSRELIDDGEDFRKKIEEYYSFISEIEKKPKIPAEIAYSNTISQPVLIVINENHNCFLASSVQTENGLVKTLLSNSVQNVSPKLLTASGYKKHSPEDEKSFSEGQIIDVNFALTTILEGYRMCKFYLTGILDPEGTIYDYEDPNLKPLFFTNREELPLYWDVKIDRKRNPEQYLLNACIKYFVYDDHPRAYNETGIALPHGFSIEQLNRGISLPIEFWRDLQKNGMLNELLRNVTSENEVISISSFCFKIKQSSENLQHEIYGTHPICSLLLQSLPYNFFSVPELNSLNIGILRRKSDYDLHFTSPLSLSKISDEKLFELVCKSIARNKGRFVWRHSFLNNVTSRAIRKQDSLKIVVLDLILAHSRFYRFGIDIGYHICSK